MSSSDSDDFEGFESAEEDVAVSDLDEDELEKILAEDSPLETNDQDISPSGDSKEIITTSENDASNSKSPVRISSHDVLINSESQDPSDGISISGSSVKQLSNLDLRGKPLDKSPQVDGNWNTEQNSNDSKLSNKNADKQDIFEKSPLSEPLGKLALSSKQIVKENSQNTSGSTLNGWDFEDEDIGLLENLEEAKPSAFSASPNKIQSSSLQLKDNYTGKISSETDHGDDNSPSGWDFEEDFDLQDSPEKKMDSNLDQPLKNSESYDSSAIWPSWGSWGVTNLISSAAEGVTASSWSHVTSGLTGLTSMLENTLGAPDPEILASELSTNEKSERSSVDEKPIEQDPSEAADLFGIGSLIGGVKNLGNKVIDGGLGTLETLGKKTMEVLQEGDPGLKKKRALLFQTEKVILSQVLRDAKEKAEASEQEHSKLTRKAQYETLFDDFHGLVHLEALEMISRQCEIKLQSLSSNNPKCSLQEFNETVNLVKSLYDQNDRDEDEDKDLENENLNTVLDSCMNTLSLNVNVKHFIEVDESIQLRLSQTFSEGTEIHSNAISDLAQFTACAIELFHRIAELFIVKDHSDIQNDFKALSRIASVSKSKIGTISENYSAKLMLLPDKSNNPLITNIFLEASNSSTYLDNAIELFAPIIQLKAL